MPHTRDAVTVEMPNVLRDRIGAHRLHPRMALHEVIEAALDFWEENGGWAPFLPAPVDGYEPLVHRDLTLPGMSWSAPRP